MAKTVTFFSREKKVTQRKAGFKKSPKVFGVAFFQKGNGFTK
jgi:hypothetical protein